MVPFGRRTRIHRWFMFKFDDAPFSINWVHKIICLTGHEPQRDQCGRPEHDHCAWCGKMMPLACGPREDRNG